LRRVRKGVAGKEQGEGQGEGIRDEG